MTTRWEDLIALADRMEPEARAAFLDAIAKLREAIDVETLSRLIARRHSAIDADAVLTEAELSADLAPLLDLVQQTLLDAGRLTADSLSRSLGTSIRFDITNTLAVQVAREAAAALVTNVTTETRNALRAIVRRAFEDGLTSRDTSALIRPLIGLTERQAVAVLNYRASLLDQLPVARVNQLADAYAAKLLRQRAAVIARTEIMAAANEGQAALWQQAVERKLLPHDQKRRWIVTPDDRLCPICRSMRNQVRGLSEPFVVPDAGATVMVPPLHPQCRCVTVLVDEKDITMRNGVWVFLRAAA